MFYGYTSEAEMREKIPGIADHLVSIAERQTIRVANSGKKAVAFCGGVFTYEDGSKDEGREVVRCRACCGAKVFSWVEEPKQTPEQQKTDTPETDAAEWEITPNDMVVRSSLARKLELERDALRRESEQYNQIMRILKNPVAVHLNMLRGTIAWTPEHLRHLLGDSQENVRSVARRAGDLDSAKEELKP